MKSFKASAIVDSKTGEQKGSAAFASKDERLTLDDLSYEDEVDLWVSTFKRDAEQRLQEEVEKIGDQKFSNFEFHPIFDELKREYKQAYVESLCTHREVEKHLHRLKDRIEEGLRSGIHPEESVDISPLPEAISDHFPAPLAKLFDYDHSYAEYFTYEIGSRYDW